MFSGVGMALVIPYRNRKEHLAKFIKHYSSILPNAHIVIMEQFDDKPFNRAKLFNIFYIEIGWRYDWFACHDVDMYLITEKTPIDVYSFPHTPTHIATRCQQFDYKMPYKNYFGGVTLFSSGDFGYVNGYSNNMWGWGAEDDEMYNNVTAKGLSVNRREAYFECAEHERVIGKEYRNNVELLKQGRGKNDGLSSCVYNIKRWRKDDSLIHIFVEC